MSTFRFLAFGGACLSDAAGPIAGPAVQPRRLALLALLAASPSGRISRDKLAAYLWSDVAPEHARDLLVDSVYALRKALGKEVLLTRGQELCLNTEIIATDVGAFLAALECGDYAEAAALYTGPFLDGFSVRGAPPFEHWAESQREHLAGRYAGALEALAERHETGGHQKEALLYWRRLAEHDPYCSRTALRLMRALVATGERAAALQQARVHEAAVRRELEMDPDPEVLALAEQLRGDWGLGSDGLSGGSHTEPSLALSALPATAVLSGHSATDYSDRTAAPPSMQSAVRRFSGMRWLRGAVLSLGVGLLLALALLGYRWHVNSSDLPAAYAPVSGHAIAVLPFTDLSPGRAHEYFSDGMTAELITTLARLEGLRVAAYTSVFSLKDQILPAQEIGRRLQVSHMLEGSVRRSGSRVRISAQLVDASTGFPLWSEAFDREMSDIFAVQQEISRAIARALELSLANVGSLGPGTADPEAYDLYLQGRYHWNLGSVEDPATQERALGFFRLAIERDPAFALAYAGMADAYSHAHEPELAKAAALKAITLDGTLAEAHIALAYVLGFHEWDWHAAERALARALELSPGSVLAYLRRANVLSALGRTEEAIADVERAVRMEPLSFIVSYNRGVAYYWGGRYEEAVRFLRHTLAMDPTRTDVRRELAHAYYGLGDTAAAAALYRSAGDTLFAVLVEGNREAMAGLNRWAEAHPERVPPSTRAFLYARMGMPDQAFEWLETAVRSRERWLPFHVRFPALASLRADPRFSVLLREMHLQE
jgi:adenylate cyclase